MLSGIIEAIHTKHGKLESGRIAHEICRRVSETLCNDLLAETRRRIAEVKPGSAADVRQYAGPMVGFSEPVREADAVLKSFLYRRMYSHYSVNRIAVKAMRVVSELFEFLLEHPGCLPEPWQMKDRLASSEDRALLIADYIAGMTDRYALLEHKRLFDLDTIR